MGAFLLDRHGGAAADTDRRRISAIFASQGFAEPEVVTASGFTLYLYAKQVTPQANLYRSENGDFCAATGTLVYRGATGEAALAAYLADFDPVNPPRDSLYGNFAVVVSKSGRAFFLLDRMGVYKAYSESGGRYWSSSFLAAAELAATRTLDPPRLYEYVFQEANHGVGTIFREVKQLSADGVYDVAAGVITAERPVTVPPVAPGSMDAHTAALRAPLEASFADIAGAFDGKIDTALSGGYDSRLALALLRAQGVTPRLHVYGPAAAPDVAIARVIAEGEGLPLEHTDKSAHPRPSPDALPEVVARNYHAFDALPADGIIDSGADLVTRQARCAGGEVMLNGGGGEIFRNFFYLPARRFSPRQIVWSFFSQYDPRAGTARFDESAYMRMLTGAMTEMFPAAGGRFNRQQVEALYPFSRCRYWMGRNNSVNNRLGPALTPFVDDLVVAAALAAPISLKNHGRLEASLIRAIDPRLAAYPSHYGHGFDRAPPIARVLSDWTTYLRPPWLRRYLFRLKTRRRPRAAPWFAAPAYRDSLFPEGLVYAPEFFHLDRIRDPSQLQRILTLEYVCQRLSPGGGGTV